MIKHFILYSIIAMPCLATDEEELKLFVQRSFSSESYQLQEPVDVTLSVHNTVQQATKIAIHETIPEQWEVKHISQQGVQHGRTIQWSLNVSPGISNVTYSVQTTAGYDVALFYGTYNGMEIQEWRYLPPLTVEWEKKPSGIWRYWSRTNGLHSSYVRSWPASASGEVLAEHRGGVFSILDGYRVRQIPQNNFRTYYENKAGQQWAVRYPDKSELFQPWIIYQYINGQWNISGEIQSASGETFPHVGLYKSRQGIFSPQKDIVFVWSQQRFIQLNAETKEWTLLKKSNDTEIGSFVEFTISPSGTLWLVGQHGIASIQWRKGKIEWRDYPLDDRFGFHEIEYFDNIKITNPIAIDETEICCVAYGTHPSVNNVIPYLLSLRNGQWNIVHSDNKNWIFWGFGNQQDGYWIFKKVPDMGTFQIFFLRENKICHIDSLHTLHGLKHRYVHGDGTGAFWVPSSYGIARYMPSTWKIPHAAPNVDDKIYDIYEDSKRRLYFLSPSYLYIRFGELWETVALPEIASEFYTHTLSELPDGTVGMSLGLIGGPKRFNSYDPKTKTFTPFPKKVLLIHKGKSGKYWALLRNEDTYDISLYDGKTFETLFTIPPNQWSTQLPYFIYEDGTQKIILGGDQEIGIFDQGEWSTYPEAPSCLSVARMSFGNLWIASNYSLWGKTQSGEAVLRKKIMDRVNSICEDHDRNIWVGTHSGLFCIKDDFWILYTAEEDLPNTIVHKIYEDSTNRLWVGTAKGFCYYDPDADRDSPIVMMPKEKNTRTISPEGEAQFIFDGVDKWNYTPKDRLLYSYRFGDGQWSEYSTETVASATGLQAGNHIFQVKSIDRNWNESAPFTWQFTVLRHWYKEPLFISILTISIFIIVCLASLAIKRHVQLSQSHVNLQNAYAKLRELDKIKTAFVSQASHDLRTPLTAIKGSLDNLLLGIAGTLNEKQEKIMTRAVKSVDRLTDLVNDVLDLSRIESGRMVLEKSNVPIKTLVESIINENKPAADQKHIRLIANLETDANIHADAGKLERVVGELVSNAIKYTPGGGNVDVALTRHEDQITLSVKDSGIGMTKEECEKIWERFYRTNASKSFAKGSGLGLSIAKELVEMHGGTILVESELNKGTTFTLLIPLVR